MSHTDTLTAGERAALLRDVHDRANTTFGEHFDFGERCYATLYSAEGAGDVDTLRDELLGLRSSTVKLPVSYLEVCDSVLSMARERAKWPVVPLSSIDTHGEAGVLDALEDLGFLRRANDLVVLEPVTWLSRLMVALLHPHHGVGRAAVAAANADSLAEHLESLVLTAEVAYESINKRGKVVDHADRESPLPLLSQFDMCFELTPGRFVFPTLLQRARSLPRWLAGSFGVAVPLVARRFECVRSEDVVPSTLATLLMMRVATSMPKDAGGFKPVFFGRGTVVVSCGPVGTVGVRASDDDRAIDVFALGEHCLALLGTALVHLASIVHGNYFSLALSKHSLTRITDADRVDPTLVEIQHPFFGPCRRDVLAGRLRMVAMTREWLACEYERAGWAPTSIPPWPYWEDRGDILDEVESTYPSDRHGVDPPTDPLRDPHMWGVSLDTLQSVVDEARQMAMDLEEDFSMWTMRDINKHIVKPLCARTGTSLAVHRSPDGRGLRAEVFVSHAWAEPFEQFAQSVFNAYSRRMRKPTLWICTFALIRSDDRAVIERQIGPRGAPLEESPFVRALKQASEILVVRNRVRDLYTRLWCVCEVYVLSSMLIFVTYQ